jgi:hypothetical protein
MNKNEPVLFHSDGVPVTQSMIDGWAGEAERGVLPGDPGPVTRGRPRSIQDDEPARASSYRLGKAREEKLERLARERGLKDRSEVLRQLIDAA